MSAALTLGIIVLWAVLWFLLDRHEKRRAANGKPRHSTLRLILAAGALLTMLFAGGCALLFAANMSGPYVNLAVIAIFSGPPFLVALLIWSLAMRRKREQP